MRTNKPISKIMAIVLSVTMIFTLMPLTVFAEYDVPPGISGEITAFAPLADEIRRQVTFGQMTPNLPETLAATVNSEETEIAVTWFDENGYNDSAAAGLYIFTAKIPDGYALAYGVNAPVIGVMRRGTGRALGAGTMANPLQITTAAQLAEISALTNTDKLESVVHGASSTEKVYLKLMNNIDLSAYGAGYNAGGGWIPIGWLDGTTKFYFNGEFDGNCKIITGLYINDNTLDGAGLFGYVGGTVKNIGVIGVKITGGKDVGGVAGVVDDGSVTNCYSSGTVSGNISIGGVAGFVTYGSVTNCRSTAAISGTIINTGGVTGQVLGGSISNCYSSGAVSGEDYVGGVAGKVEDSSVENCYAGSAVTGTNYVGGVAGIVISGGKVENCAALNPSVIAANSEVGRVAGFVTGELSNNVAFNGMTNGGGIAFSNTKTLTGLDGLDLDAADANDTIGGRFTATNGWTISNDKLPGLFGETVEPPPHLINAAVSPFGGGDGSSEAQAYEISTPEQLVKLAAFVNEDNATYNTNTVYYKLTANLDLSAYGINWNGGKGWVPIGHATGNLNYFEGNFNGNGKTISGLYINNPYVDLQNSGYDSAGLFGIVSGGEVKNLGLVGANITGGKHTGGVAGLVESAGRVSNCYVTGTVNGNEYVGGVTGLVESAGSVTNCYATGAVGGKNYVGGVAGYVTNAGSEVKNCAALNPSVKGSGANIGRVVGIKISGTLAGNVALSGMFDSNSDTDSWGNAGADDLDGLSVTALEIIADGTLSSSFVNNNDPWTTTNGKLPGFNGTVDMPAHINERGSFFAGFGTSASPFLISTVAELEMLATFVNGGIAPYADAVAYYRLTTDIDLSAYGANNVAPIYGSKGWVPIGHSNVQKFLGNFDGDNHIISGLYIDNINNTGYDNVGLFGNVQGGDIINLGITSVNITNNKIPSSLTGGLAGRLSSGSIENCYTTGNIKGFDNTGGLVGDFNGTHIYSCFSAAMVNGNGNTGGLVGNLQGGDVIDSYTTSAVDGWNNVGGVVGSTGNTTPGMIKNCYATGAVSGNTAVGGVIGNASAQATVENCAALNPSVYAQTLGAGRVAGALVPGGTLTNNRVFNGMAVDGAAFTGTSAANGADGADMNKANAINPAFWTETMNWTTPPWTFIQGKLPTINAAAQNSDPGIYLTQLPPDPVTPPVNPPVNPPGGGGSSSGGGGSSSTTPSPKTVDVKINGQVLKVKLNADGTLTLNCTEADVKKYADKTGEFVIAVSEPDSITLSINIPALGADDLTLQTSLGTITIPNETLHALRELYGDTLRLVIVKSSFKVALINSNKNEIAYSDPANPFIVTLPYSLQNWQKTGAIVAVNKNGVIFPFGVYQDGAVTFEIAATGTYDLKYNAKTFSDIADHWAADYIGFMTAREIFNGTGNGQFTPNGSMTRGMFAMALANLDGVDLSAYKTSRFGDVTADQWYAAAVEWAADKGIVIGYCGKFDPNALITREQMALILYNYMKYKGYAMQSGSASAFADENNISSWAYEAVKAVQKMGIVGGKPGNLYDPQGIATRGEVAAIFARLVGHVAGMAAIENKATASNSMDMNTALAMLPGKENEFAPADEETQV